MNGTINLLLIVVLVVVLVVWMGWFGVSTETHQSGHKENVDIQLTMDKGKIQQDANAAAERAREIGAETQSRTREIARKIGSMVDANSSFWLSQNSVNMTPNAKTTIQVNRSGSELPAAQVNVTVPADGSILAMGGQFHAGETTIPITIEALPNAQSGSILFESGGKTATLTVNITR